MAKLGIFDKVIQFLTGAPDEPAAAAQRPLREQYHAQKAADPNQPLIERGVSVVENQEGQQYFKVSPDGWVRFNAMSEEKASPQSENTGWKLHVSASTKEAQEQLARLAMEYGIPEFKFAPEPDKFLNPEYKQAGKTAVFYHAETDQKGNPIDWAGFIAKAEAIVQANGGPGPVVQRDARIDGTEGVFYRHDKGAHGEKYVARAGLTMYGAQNNINESQLYNLGNQPDPFARIIVQDGQPVIVPQGQEPRRRSTGWQDYGGQAPDTAEDRIRDMLEKMQNEGRIIGGENQQGMPMVRFVGDKAELQELQQLLEGKVQTKFRDSPSAGGEVLQVRMSHVLSAEKISELLPTRIENLPTSYTRTPAMEMMDEMRKLQQERAANSPVADRQIMQEMEAKVNAGEPITPVEFNEYNRIATREAIREAQQGGNLTFNAVNGEQALRVVASPDELQALQRNLAFSGIDSVVRNSALERGKLILEVEGDELVKLKANLPPEINRMMEQGGLPIRSAGTRAEIQAERASPLEPEPVALITETNPVAVLQEADNNSRPLGTPGNADKMYRVENPAQAEQLVGALRELGIPDKYITLSDEGVRLAQPAVSAVQAATSAYVVDGDDLLIPGRRKSYDDVEVGMERARSDVQNRLGREELVGLANAAEERPLLSNGQRITTYVFSGDAMAPAQEALERMGYSEGTDFVISGNPGEEYLRIKTGAIIRFTDDLEKAQETAARRERAEIRRAAVQQDTVVAMEEGPRNPVAVLQEADNNSRPLGTPGNADKMYRVENPAQAEQLVGALRELGIPDKYITLSDEGVRLAQPAVNAVQAATSAYVVDGGDLLIPGRRKSYDDVGVSMESAQREVQRVLGEQELVRLVNDAEPRKISRGGVLATTYAFSGDAMGPAQEALERMGYNEGTDFVISGKPGEEYLRIKTDALEQFNLDFAKAQETAARREKAEAARINAREDMAAPAPVAAPDQGPDTEAARLLRESDQRLIERANSPAKQGNALVGLNLVEYGSASMREKLRMAAESPGGVQLFSPDGNTLGLAGNPADLQHISYTMYMATGARPEIVELNGQSVLLIDPGASAPGKTAVIPPELDVRTLPERPGGPARMPSMPEAAPESPPRPEDRPRRRNTPPGDMRNRYANGGVSEFRNDPLIQVGMDGEIRVRAETPEERVRRKAMTQPPVETAPVADTGELQARRQAQALFESGIEDARAVKGDDGKWLVMTAPVETPAYVQPPDQPVKAAESPAPRPGMPDAPPAVGAPDGPATPPPAGQTPGMSPEDLGAGRAGTAMGLAGIAQRAEAIRQNGVMSTDAVALGLDSLGMMNNNAGTSAGLVGNLFGAITDTKRAYDTAIATGKTEEEALQAGAMQGAKSLGGSVVTAEVLSAGSTLQSLKASVETVKNIPSAIKAVPTAIQETVAAVKGAANIKNAAVTVREGATIANLARGGKGLVDIGKGLGKMGGQLGLANSLITGVSDLAEYQLGTKEATSDNLTQSAAKTALALDPLKAVSSIANITKLVGVDTGIQNVSMFSVADKLTGGKGEDFEQITNETKQIYAEEAKRFKATEIDRQFRRVDEQGTLTLADGSTMEKPLMSDYKHLGALKYQVASAYQRETGKELVIDGKKIPAQFNEVDMTKTENYMAYRNAINIAQREQGRIMEENSSMLPRWLRSGESTDKYNEAESTNNMLNAAADEFRSYETRILAYNQEKENVERLAKAEIEKAKADMPEPKGLEGVTTEEKAQKPMDANMLAALAQFRQEAGANESVGGSVVPGKMRQTERGNAV